MGAQAARICSGELGQQWRLELGLFGHGAPNIVGVQQELLGKVAGEAARHHTLVINHGMAASLLTNLVGGKQVRVRSLILCFQTICVTSG